MYTFKIFKDNYGFNFQLLRDNDIAMQNARQYIQFNVCFEDIQKLNDYLSDLNFFSFQDQRLICPVGNPLVISYEFEDKSEYDQMVDELLKAPKPIPISNLNELLPELVYSWYHLRFHTGDVRKNWCLGFSSYSPREDQFVLDRVYELHREGISIDMQSIQYWHIPDSETAKTLVDSLNNNGFHVLSMDMIHSDNMVLYMFRKQPRLSTAEVPSIEEPVLS